MTITTEQYVPVLVGTTANDGTGDTLRAAFQKVNNNFANIADIGVDTGNINCQGTIEVLGNLVVSNTYVPTLANSIGTTGQIAWTSNHVYICVATDTWKRANISTW